MTLLETLYKEHENISHFIEQVQADCIEFLTQENFDVSKFHDTVDYIRTYADQEHHLKEEQYLFRAMTKELGIAAINLIQHGMLVEHDMARLLVNDLEKALISYEKTRSNQDKLDILANAMGYVYLLRRHVIKENTAVFPFAERSLKPETMKALEEAFQAGKPYEG